MKIALIGHGKMGRMIEEIAASERGHQIVCIIDEHNPEDIHSPEFASADVAIEFTRPEAALQNVLNAFKAGVPVVSGTTGWNDSLPQIKEMCERGEGTLMWASNFSVGVNIFMAINRQVAAMMAAYPQYKPTLEETHHIHKLDWPSGTAITLAEEIMAGQPALKGWQDALIDAPHSHAETSAADIKAVPDNILPVVAYREGEVPGIHTVKWESDADEIILTHSAKSRRGFALGAVLAAEWMQGKKGYHNIGEMYGY